VSQATGLAVLDAGTGAERWHYRYAGRTAWHTIASADGSVLVEEYGDYEGTGLTLVGFDRATGRQLWWHDWPAGKAIKVDHASVLAAGDSLLLSTEGDLDSQHGIQLVALSVHNGSTRWRRNATDFGKSCTFRDTTAAGRTVVASIECNGPSNYLL